MSSANLDLVRSIYAAWQRGDFLSSAEWADPEIEFVIVEGPNPGSWTGLAGMAESMRGFLSAWESLRVKTDEYREIDEERVLVFTRLSRRGKTSGLDLGQMQNEQVHLLEICGDKVTRLAVYNHREHALADLGLDPETG